MPFYNDAYRRQQADRLDAALQTMLSRERAVRDGRMAPEHGDLPIGSGRRVSATVLFLDVCGSSGRGSDDQAPQEEALRTMTIFFGEMIRILTEFGARVEKNTGDGLMAYFTGGQDGMSIQHTAVAAAITMMATAENAIAPALRSVGLQPWPFRICMEHGPITVAEVGAARLFRGIVAIGTTANIAAKMLAVARSGDLLIGDAVLHGLPEVWQEHATETLMDTGWLYRTGRPYPFHRFTGRWRTT